MACTQTNHGSSCLNWPSRWCLWKSPLKVAGVFLFYSAPPLITQLLGLPGPSRRVCDCVSFTAFLYLTTVITLTCATGECDQATNTQKLIKIKQDEAGKGFKWRFWVKKSYALNLRPYGTVAAFLFLVGSHSVATDLREDRPFGSVASIQILARTRSKTLMELSKTEPA